jgi:hypothetical protein
MAKELRRMGLEVVAARSSEDEEMSSTDVKQVTDSAKAIAQVAADARRIRQKLDQSIAEVNDALGIADGVADALRSAGAELRGALGAQTNNPPEDAPAAGGSAGGVPAGDAGG